MEIDTTAMLKAREKWRPGMTHEKLIREMNEKLQFPGLTNTWTMPVQLPISSTGLFPSLRRARLGEV
jgi:Cu(I)/Ag(I) efflux system membrane protein CusA/SilA